MPRELQHSPTPRCPHSTGKMNKLQQIQISPLTRAQLRLAKKIVGLFQYYAATIGNTMMTAINSIATITSMKTFKYLNYRM